MNLLRTRCDCCGAIGSPLSTTKFASYEVCIDVEFRDIARASKVRPTLPKLHFAVADGNGWLVNMSRPRERVETSEEGVRARPFPQPFW